MLKWVRFFSSMKPISSPGGVLGHGSKPTVMQVFREIAPLRDFRRQLLLSQKSLGLVPTMGALHDGHLSLIRQAAQENDNVIVSIYVNPTQFGLNEDLDTYPRTWDKDMKMLTDLDKEFEAKTNAQGHSNNSQMGRITAVFAPTTKTMYPNLPPSSDPAGYGTFVTVTPLATLLEGASRPVFFRGVATVCMKLFNIVTPDKVYFGQKDVQQTVVIKRMVKDLCVGSEVVVGPTMREPDGLAMSSRNVYLGRRRRHNATVLVRSLRKAEEQYKNGKVVREDILGPARMLLESLASEQDALDPQQRTRFEVDYISLADPDSMEEVAVVDEAKGAILSGAVRMLPVESPAAEEDDGGKFVRLIDNIILKPKK